MSRHSPAYDRAYRANWRGIIMRGHVYDRVVGDMNKGESRGDVIERWSREVKAARSKSKKVTGPVAQ
jgi:hypothetical protein